MQARHSRPATAHSPLQLAPIILAIRSSMRLASQNGAKMRGIHACEISFRRLFRSLERARSTQWQFRPMWRRFGLPASKCITGNLLHLWAAPLLRAPYWVVRIRVAADMLAWLLPWSHIAHIPHYNAAQFTCISALFTSCLTRARIPLRPRQCGLGHSSLKKGQFLLC